MDDWPSPVYFTIGSDGRAMSLVIDNLNSNGFGTLARRQ
jgi:hypothetical protein